MGDVDVGILLLFSVELELWPLSLDVSRVTYERRPMMC